MARRPADDDRRRAPARGASGRVPRPGQGDDDGAREAPVPRRGTGKAKLERPAATSGRARSARASGRQRAPEAAPARPDRPERPKGDLPAAGGHPLVADPDLLPRPGAPMQIDRVDREVRRIVGELREACGACGYRRLCAFAPVKLQIEAHAAEQAGGAVAAKKTKHRHAPVLDQGLARLAALDGPWERALARLLFGREKDALLAGCLLARAWRRDHAPLRALLAYTLERCEVERQKEELAAHGSDDATGLAPGQGVAPEVLQARMFRGHVLRLASFFPDEDVLVAMQELLVLAPDDEGRIDQLEAVAALALLIGRRLPGAKWIRALEKDAKGPFRATFAARDPGGGAVDLFFPYRRGKRRSYLYLRRDPGQVERLTSVDKIRIDSLLYRVFLVFGPDEHKTHRVFKELCRHLNVRAGKFNANHVLAGFQRLSRDDLLLLAVYAPALARAVGHYLELDDLHQLVKLLYALRGESGRRGEAKTSAHEQVVRRRDEWERLVRALGAETIKQVFALLFRLNASYVRRIYTTPTYLKIGEVAYLLTALSGWNPKGLEVELKQGKKALAFVAYGLQPPSKWSRVRVGKLQRARLRAEDKGQDELVRAAEQGQRYMALLHGYDRFDDLARDAAAEGWEPPAEPPRRQPRAGDVSGEDFSEFEDDRDSDTGDVEEPVEGDDDGSDTGDEEIVMFADESETYEDGRLRTQRLKRGERR